MEEADEFKSTKYFQLQYWIVASQTILKFQDQGYQVNQESQGMINNELQGIKITSMSMQPFWSEGLGFRECQTILVSCSSFVFRFNEKL
jgi:hypothetical protein